MTIVRASLLLVIVLWSDVTAAKDPKIVRAVMDGDAARVERLVQQNADLDETGEDGRRALAYAAAEGNLEIAKLLIDGGAGIDLPGEGGFTAMARATLRGNADMMALLAANGADPDARMARGRTLLHLLAGQSAAQDFDGVGTAAELIRLGSNVDAVDVFGQTPLHLAAGAGRVDMVELLLGQGADPNVKNRYGETPLTLASDLESGAAATYLAERGAVMGERKPLLTKDSNCRLDSGDLWYGMPAAAFQEASGLRIGLTGFGTSILADDAEGTMTVFGVTVKFDSDMRIVGVECQ